MAHTRSGTVVGCLALAMAGAAYLQAARMPAASPSSSSSSEQQSVVPPQPTQTAPAVAAVSPQKALVNQYCVTCHNDRAKAGGLGLDKVNVDEIADHPDIWEKVVRKLRAGAMPPANARRPDATTLDGFASWLETGLDRLAAANPNPGVLPAHRLNRLEYTNAVRDLLALEIDGQSLLPADDSGYGFDNIAAVLSVSPGLLERYMSAARKISRSAVGDPSPTPIFETHDISTYLSQDDRMDEDLPFGSRGGATIRHHFPADGEYVLKIRLLRRDRGDNIPGLDHQNHLEVRLNGERLKMFTVGEERQTNRLSRAERAAARGAGTVSRRGSPAESQPVAGAEPEKPAASPAVSAAKPEKPAPAAAVVAGDDDDRPARVAADAGLELRFAAKAGPAVLGVSFVKRTEALPEGLAPARMPIRSLSFLTLLNEPAVERVRIDGPYNVAGVGDTPSRRRIFVCRPTAGQNEESCARTILSTLATRAFRRPATDADVTRLLAFYQSGRSERGFEGGIELALRSILVDPEFLFRIERDAQRVQPSGVAPVSDLDLASRLSFFLWSSIPDDELLQIASRRELSRPAILQAQVRRLLADTRSSTLVSNFFAQWLFLRNMQVVVPDPRAFPEFDDSLREALQQETQLFLDSQLREDRSVVDLLSANYTFLNERLARHYQIPNVAGSHFRRVTLADEHQRAGLLGHGSVLTVTSYAERTSPTRRGKWLLENILGTPPPPPPPDVPDLVTPPEDHPLSMRERLEVHRKNPVCASCHRQMDPLGFALENFDGVGKWRTLSEANTAIDASGALPDGTKFEGAAELRAVLLKHRSQFVTTVTEKVLTYALGRGLEHYDAPAVRQIVREAAPNDYRWSSIILGIVNSTPFRMRALSESQPSTSTLSNSGRSK